jgi:hypothetical protein
MRTVANDSHLIGPESTVRALMSDFLFQIVQRLVRIGLGSIGGFQSRDVVRPCALHPSLEPSGENLWKSRARTLFNRLAGGRRTRLLEFSSQ